MKRPSKVESGRSCQYFRLCSTNSLNPDVWSFRKGAKIAAKLEHHGGSARKVEKQLKTARKVEKKLRPSRKRVEKQLKHAAKEANKNNNNNQNNQNNQNKRNQNRISQDLQRAMKEVSDADHYLPHNRQYHIQGRDLEDDEELLRRDLDGEDSEIFGREYDILVERDTFDDLD